MPYSWMKTWQKGAADLLRRWNVLPQGTASQLRHSVAKKMSDVDLRGAYIVYDKITGLDQVRVAHEEVAQAEKKFVERQVERRVGQTECFQLEEARNRLNAQMDSVNRSDENFLRLVTHLHELSRQHKEARERLNGVEVTEQLAFDQFSGALRRSQAEERIQANRMRQWSIGLSVLAGLVGFGATWLRFHGTHASTNGIAMTSTIDENSILLLQHVDQRISSIAKELEVITNQLKQVIKIAQSFVVTQT